MMHSSKIIYLKRETYYAFVQMFNVANGASFGDPIDIRVRNQFYKMEAQGKRMYKQAMVKIGIEV